MKNAETWPTTPPLARAISFLRQHQQAAVNTQSPSPVTPATAGTPVASVTPVPLITPPAPKDRRCYQCRHLQRSVFGFPLGLCKARDNAIYHVTSEPTRFGCADFALRQPAATGLTCLDCQQYDPVSAWCSKTNLACPYPAIPPCCGEYFQPIRASLLDTAAPS